MKKKYSKKCETLLTRIGNLDSVLRSLQIEMEDEEFYQLPNHEQIEILQNFLGVLSDHLIGAKLKYKKAGGDI